MSISLSSATDTLSKKAFADVRTLMLVEFTKPISGTFRFSDQHLPNCGGAEWLPYVLDWGGLTDRVSLSEDLSASVGSATITLNNALPINSRARLSDYIYTPQNTRSTYEWANAKVTLYQALSPTADAADLVTLGVYYMEEPQDIGQELLVLRMSDISLVVDNKINLYKINSTDLSNAPPSSVGQYTQMIFGALLTADKKVNLLPVVAGKATSLTEDLDNTETDITVTSTTGFPASGDILIGTEIIGYTSVTSTSFAGCTRANRGSTAASHTNGDTVLEVRSGSPAYRFIVGENILGGHSAVGTLYTNGASAPSNISTTTTLANTSLVSGRSFTTLDFNVTATDAAIRQFHLAALGVETIVNSTSTFPLSQIADQVSPADVNCSFSATAPVLPIVGSWNVRATVSVTRTAGSTPFTTMTASAVLDGGLVQICEVTDDAGTPTSGDVLIGDYEGSGSLLGIRFTWTGGAGSTFQHTVHSCAQVFTPTSSLSSSGAESTVAACIGNVAALVTGITDDGSGTISGSAGLLLENPTDIAKAIMTQLYTTTPGIVIADCGTSWATSRTKHAAKAYKWAGVLTRTTFSDLRSELMRHGRALLYFAAGKIEWKYIDDGPAADFSVTYSSDVDAESPALIRRSERTRLWNDLTVKSQIEPTTGEYARSATWQDLTQSGLTDSLPLDLTLPWVQDTTTADDLGRFWRDQWKRPRLECTFDSWWNLIALQIGDVVQFVNHTILDDHGGSEMTFRVVGRTSMPGRGQVRVELREAANLFWDRESFAQAFTDEPRAVPGLIPSQYANSEHVRARRDPLENNDVYGGRNRLLMAMGA